MNKYKFTTKQELIELAQTCDELAARWRNDDVVWMRTRDRAFKYRREARKRTTP